MTSGATTTSRRSPGRASSGEAESLFERFGWFHSFLRERVFQDDTNRIAAALWPGAAGAPPARSILLEVGCGPGFYSRRLAARYPQLQVVKVDCSSAQLRRAERGVTRERLTSCRFQRADACALPWMAETVEAVLSSRFFPILPDGARRCWRRCTACCVPVVSASWPSRAPRTAPGCL